MAPSSTKGAVTRLLRNAAMNVTVAICAYEANSQARPVSAAGLERRQGRSAAYSYRAEPEAARQASLPCPATSGSCLPRIDNREQAPRPTQRGNAGPAKTRKLCNRDQPSFATQSRAKPTWRIYECTPLEEVRAICGNLPVGPSQKAQSNLPKLARRNILIGTQDI